MERAPAAKLDQLVQGVEGEVCSCEFNVQNGYDNIGGGCRARPLSGEALIMIIS